MEKLSFNNVHIFQVLKTIEILDVQSFMPDLIWIIYFRYCKCYFASMTYFHASAYCTAVTLVGIRMFNFQLRIQTIPFVLELRGLLDWVCTDSTLTLFHWLKMEDIYANIYILKCYRTAEKVKWLEDSVCINIR